MPALTANFSTEVSGSLREDFSDIVTVIDPTETPIQANIAQTDISNPEGYDYQIDNLNTASTAGQTDGFAFSALGDSVTARIRLKSRAMIQARGFTISDRLEATDKAGADSEIANQLALRSEDLKRDCEASITTFRTPVASASGTAPLAAGIPTWIRTNRSFGATGADPTLSGSEPVVGTDGTPRAVDESIFLDLLGQCYDSGGNPDMVSVSRAVKQVMSQYFFTTNARIATPYQDHGRSPSSGIQVVGAVDYYVSDFGVLAIVPNRFQRSTDVLILDTSLFELGVFRGYQVRQMGIDGDRESYMILHDFTVISRQEAGSACFADASGSTAMVA